MRKLVVHRRGYVRRAHMRRSYRRKDGTLVKATKVKETRVPPTTYKITDRGAPGRGKKVIPHIEKGKMTRVAVQLGLIKQGGHIGELNLQKLKKLADELVKRYGARTAKGMFQAQEIFRKRMPSAFREKMRKVREYIGDKYSKKLVPREAINKWKSMSPRARAKAMPERKGRKGYKLIKGRWRKV